jgi:ribonuclease P/MRP protein subunit POP7
VSASSSFIATVKRVQKLLGHIEARSTPHVKLTKNGDKEILKAIREGIEESRKGGEEVVMKATGKAIEKALQLALWFQGQEDVVVKIRTGSVGAVDDVVMKDDGGDEEGEGEVEQSRVRRASVLEVGVSLR